MVYKVSTTNYCFCARSDLSKVIADYQIEASQYHTQVLKYGANLFLRKAREAVILVQRRSFGEFRVLLNYYCKQVLA